MRKQKCQNYETIPKNYWKHIENSCFTVVAVFVYFLHVPLIVLQFPFRFCSFPFNNQQKQKEMKGTSPKHSQNTFCFAMLCFLCDEQL